jgi:FHS family L-fucose permease-like MFS transporter
MNTVKPSQTKLLLITISIFFFWGFSASANALLIPVLKEKFSLSQFQAQMVELSFYIAYFTGSLSFFYSLFPKDLKESVQIKS